MARCLVVGPDFHNYNEAVLDALLVAGFETQFVDSNLVSDSFVFKVSQRLCPSLHRAVHRRRLYRLNRRILREYYAFRPDLVVVVKGDTVQSETVRAMSSASFSVLWAMDSILRVPLVWKSLPYFDRCYTFEPSDIVAMRPLNSAIRFLPVGYDDSVYRPLDLEREVDVCFVGELDSSRRELLESLVLMNPSVNFEIFGIYSHWAFVRRYCHRLANPLVRKAFKNRRISPEETNELYNRSKICLNVHNSQSLEGWNPRTEEILGSGSFEIVDDRVGVRREFSGALVWFESLEDLNSKIGWYLEEGGERESIAQVGRLRVADSHTVRASVDRVIREFRMS